MTPVSQALQTVAPTGAVAAPTTGATPSLYGQGISAPSVSAPIGQQLSNFGHSALNFGHGVLDPSSTDTFKRLQAGESPGAGDVAQFYLQRFLNDQLQSALGPARSLAQPLPQREPLRRPFEGQRQRRGGVFNTYTGGAF